VNCRHCKHPLEHVFLDLGFAPPSNAYLSVEDLKKPEVYFPLKLFVCEHCWLVQTEDYADAGQLFSHNYAYFSSVSQSWLDHAARYVSMITERLGLNKNSQVIEIASNDGYLLRNFVGTEISCLGIEPTDSTAMAAEKLGIPVLRKFFGKNLAERLVAEGKQANLIIGNNVYAHVPDINDFTAGLKAALKPEGTITLEFPHLMRLIEHTQFDTVYHEHFSYLSLHTVSRIFQQAGLRIWDVEELPTHGGSLRIYGCHAEKSISATSAVDAVLVAEARQGLRSLEAYHAFQIKADRVKNDFLGFLIEQKRAGKTIAAYGAAAKGNTLLNYAGIKPDLLPYVVDAASSKQGKFLPGSHIQIYSPELLKNNLPDVLLILPWNIADEIRSQFVDCDIKECRFVVAVPELSLLE
jgi:hypothetical protein